MAATRFGVRVMRYVFLFLLGVVTGYVLGYAFIYAQLFWSLL
jgi:hypothetical protein